jgi:bilirubin oxidase
MDVINYTIPLDNVEIWSLINSSPIAHPFHIHDVQFYILDINGVAPQAHEQGRKDVVMVMPMQTVRFITKFEDFTSDTMPYMYHCHLLTHEDDGMMGQFLVRDTSTVSAMQHSEKLNVKLFPNPFSDKATLMLDIDLADNLSLEIYDLQGKMLRSIQNISTKIIEIDRKGMPLGNYFYVLRSDGKIIYSGKFTLTE